MEESSQEEKIKYMNKIFIEKGINPKFILDYFTSKNINCSNIFDSSLSELIELINSIKDENKTEKENITKETQKKINNKKKAKKIIIDNDEKYGVIIPEFINCKKNEISGLNQHENIEVKIKSKKKIDKGFFSSNIYYIFNVKTIPLNFNVERKYCDFQWLREKLITIYSGNIIPHIEEKETNLEEKIEQKYSRKSRILEKFLHFILNDPLIRTSNILYDFLSIENYTEFNNKKFDYDKIKQIKQIKDFKSINGKARININEKKEKYFENMIELNESLENILNKINDNFYLLKSKMNETINQFLNFIPLFDNLIKIVEKNDDHLINIESFKKIKSIFDFWVKILKKQESFFFEDINEYFKFISGNTNYTNKLIQNVENLQSIYYEASNQLISTNKEFLENQNNNIWNIFYDEDINDIQPIKTSRIVSSIQLDEPETLNAIKQKEIYGFHLNKLISEYERMKYIYAKNNKNIIVTFSTKQQFILLEYIQQMKDIIGKIDLISSPEFKDCEKLFESEIENDKVNKKDSNSQK